MSFDPEKIEAFKTLFANNAEYIRNSKGCLKVDLLQDAKNKSLFFTHSHWDNADSLEAYRKSELFGKVWKATKLLFNDKPQAWSLDLLDEDPREK